LRELSVGLREFFAEIQTKTRATAEKRNSGQTKISNKFTVFLSKIRTDSPEWVKFTHGEFCDRLFLYVGEYNKGINRAAAGRSGSRRQVGGHIRTQGDNQP